MSINEKSGFIKNIILKLFKFKLRKKYLLIIKIIIKNVVVNNNVKNRCWLNKNFWLGKIEVTYINNTNIPPIKIKMII